MTRSGRLNIGGGAGFLAGFSREKHAKCFNQAPAEGTRTATADGPNPADSIRGLARRADTAKPPLNQEN